MRKRNGLKEYDVSIDDGMVVDCEGSVWIYDASRDVWAYITENHSSTWDYKDFLPSAYAPYTVLDASAQAVIKRGLGR